MSSLFHVSRLVSRKRAILQPRRILLASRSLSSHNWAPAAYRTPRPQKTARGGNSKLGSRNKKMGRGRDGLWQDLQQVYGNQTTGSKKDETWKKRHELRREEQLSKTNTEFRAVLHRYRNALFPSSTSSTQNIKGSLIKLLQKLHNLCAFCEQDVVVSMETILKTEDQFRDLGKLTRQLISLHARMSLSAEEQYADTHHDNDTTSLLETNSALAENLLRALIQLKQDRSLLVERAQEQLQQEEESKQQQEQQGSGVMQWLKGVFVVASGEDNDEQSETTEPENPTTVVLAHEEASFGPTKRQYTQVIKSLRRDSYVHKWELKGDVDIPAIIESRNNESERNRQAALLTIAHRMAALLELHLEQGGVPSTSLTLPVMETYAQVGSLDSADEARRIYLGPCRRKTPRQVFHAVLRAYRLAALLEETADARAKAATMAMSLLKDRDHYSFGSTTSYYSPSNGKKDPRGESYAIVLETLQNAGQRALKDRIPQAEALLKLYLGEACFNAVVGNSKEDPPSKVDIHAFEPLLFMYTSYPKYLNMAKSILKCAEDQQATETTKFEKKDDVEEERPVFPNTRSYNAVLTGIHTRLNVLQHNMLQRKNEEENRKARQTILDETNYAYSCLDRMTATSPPDLKTFELLLELQARVESPESGERAQEILSRMSIRQACTGTSGGGWSGSSKVYSHLLQCWAVGPEASSSGNLDRSLRIVDKMEAESGIQYLRGSNTSDKEQEVFDSVYEQNEKESYKAAYNGALKICSQCQDESDEAFEAAFDIYNRMIAAGVPPDRDTYTHLFAACLLPGKDEEALQRRRDLASTVIAFASDHGMDTRRMYKQLKSIKKKGNNGKRKKSQLP